MLVIGIVAFIGVLVFLNMGGGIMPVSPPATIVSVEPSSVEVASEGQQVVLTVLITEVEDLYGWQVDLRWEGSATFIDATLPASHVFSGQETYGPIVYEDALGVQLARTLLGVEPGFSGDGVLVEVKFRLSGVGSTVAFYVAERTCIIDSDGNDIPFGVG